MRAEDVRDIGLRGATDDRVLAYARAEDLVIISRDLGFANTLTIPLGSHAGIVVCRLPNQVTAATVTERVVEALADLATDDLHGNLLVVEMGRVQLRRSSS
ncbi:MAG: DUF5615 family PIN-like protein [Planctomycetota bacterium]